MKTNNATVIAGVILSFVIFFAVSHTITLIGPGGGEARHSYEMYPSVTASAAPQIEPGPLSRQEPAEHFAGDEIRADKRVLADELPAGMPEASGDMDDESSLSESVSSALADREDDGFKGVRISGLKKGGLAEIAGLRNGDVIKVVNDQRLDNPQRAIQVFRKIRKQTGQVDVVLLRKDEPVKLSYRIRN